jgi:hypothetical protein
MNEFSDIINEAIFFNTPLELKEKLHFNSKTSQIEIRPTNSDNKEECFLFGYIEFEDEERNYRFKNKIVASLFVDKRIKKNLFIQGIEIELSGGIELINKINKGSYLYEENSLVYLEAFKGFIKGKIKEKLINDLLTLEEIELFDIKKTFINKHNTLLEDLMDLNLTFTNKEILIFN